jgi:hypothetical protein
MHAMSVSASKGIKQGRPSAPHPHEGTRTRELYDFFKANEGVPLKLTSSRKDRAKIAALQDVYGLDIRCLWHGTWVLAGEWFGSRYVDYIAQRITERSRD